MTVINAHLKVAILMTDETGDALKHQANPEIPMGDTTPENAVRLLVIGNAIPGAAIHVTATPELATTHAGIPGINSGASTVDTHATGPELHVGPPATDQGTHTAPGAVRVDAEGIVIP